MAHQQRNAMVDFWRGVVLVTIFVNHIPGNVLENATHRNIGLSDGAEAFVFLSGLAVALVYSQRVGQDAVDVIWRCVKRAAYLYRVHLVLTASAIALFAAADAFGDLHDLIEPHGRGPIFHDTSRGITGVLALGHQLGFFNILPLYVVLMLWAPVALILLRAHLGLGIGVSALIYMVARIEGWNLPSWPEPGGWYFNPLAWQLLFTLGVAAGLVWRDRPMPAHPILVRAALAVLALSALAVTNGFGFLPGLWESWRHGIDVPKSELGLGRLVHFLALAYVLTLWPVSRRLGATPAGQAMQCLGRHALPVFAVGSFLSALGEVIMTLTAVRSSAGPELIGMIYTLAGLVALLALARVSEWNRFEPFRRHGSSSAPRSPLPSLQQPS